MSKEEKLEKKAHHEHDDLAGEHKFGDSGQLILFAVFIVVWIADSFILHYTDFPAQYISFYIRIGLASVIFVFGGYLAMASHNILFKEKREIPAVIRKGIFGTVRHPLYLGSILFYLGLLIITCSLIAAGIWLIIIGFYHFIARYEEKLLLEKFGEDYIRYMKKVPMWVPRTVK